MSVMNKRTVTFLTLIVLFTLALRLIFAFTTPNLTYDSYFHVKQVEHVTQTGQPLFNDPLSFGGKEVRFLPFFHYLMALFNLILPIAILTKLIPNILLATLPILTFLIAKQLTNNDNASLVASLVTALLPILFITNTFTPLTLVFPLAFLAIYSFLKIKETKYLYTYLVSFIILSFTSSTTFLILMGFGIYLLLSVLERKKIKKSEIELILFSVFFFLWAQFIFFKDAFLKEGVGFIWQNIPTEFIIDYLPKPTIPEALVAVSIIPFIAGVYIVYRSLFSSHNQKAFLLISLVVSTTLLSWAGLIEFQSALIFVGLIISILFAFFFQDWQQFLQKTRFAKKKKLFSIILVIVLIASMIPSLISTATAQTTPSEEDMATFVWLKDHTPKDATIVALLEEGHLITYVSQKKNVMDNQFHFIDNINERFLDITAVYTTQFQTDVLQIFDKYQADYLVVTPLAKEKFNLENIPYISRDCFTKIYNEGTWVYLVRCELTEQ